MSSQRRSRVGAYTIIELVTVLVIVGLLAAVALPRFFSQDVFATAGFANEVRAGLRHAQSVAIASGCDVRVSLSVSSLTLQRWVGGASCSDHSGTLTTLTRFEGGAYTAAVPVGLSPTLFNLYFDTLGKPWDAGSGSALSSALAIAIGTETVTVNPETGLVQ
jgi:MSHA pilin protein MshC